MKKFLKEFKAFALKGNALDLAVGVIIGAAFQAIVTSLTKDIISPIIGLFANTDFSDLVIKISDVEIRYGAFITAVINFIIMALVIFVFIKVINRTLKGKKEEPKPAVPTTKKCPYCLKEVDIKAVKCAYCTSDLPEEGGKTA